VGLEVTLIKDVTPFRTTAAVRPRDAAYKKRLSKYGKIYRSVCRLCRREGQKLFLKGDRCYTGKCAMERRPVPPGAHGTSRNRKQSEYGMQLREKQKARRYYGVWRASSTNTTRWP
jgi:ribosomal protein S4